MPSYDHFGEAFEDCGGDINELIDDVMDYFKKHLEQIKGVTPELSVGTIYALSYAEHFAANSSRSEIAIRHILHGLWQLEDSYALYYMEKQDIDEIELLSAMADYMDEDEYEDSENDSFTENEMFGGNIDDEAYETGDFDGADEAFEFEKLGNENSGFRNGAAINRKKSKQKKNKDDISTYAPCINDSLDDVNPLIGREEELERTIQILCRKDKNNPLHIGEPGVGKTAITYGLARLINEDKVPLQLKGAKIFALDLGGMLAGTQYRGDFEKRFKKVLTEIEKETNPIIYIDEIHNLAGAGAVGESSFDAGNMLKPYLAGGHIRFIGATTFEEYKKYFEKNKSLVRRFQNVEIKEPGEEETVKILKGLKDNYESFHGVVYTDDILEYAVSMSAKHINERYLPDKAIDLIDEAGAYVKLHPRDVDSTTEDFVDNPNELSPVETDNNIIDNNTVDQNTNKIQIVDKDIINEVLTKICRVPIETVNTDNADGLSTLDNRLKNKIYGQDEAVSQVVNAVKFSRAGLLEEGKPLASLLFVGPTGVGKTEVARTLASELGVKLIRFDMSEYGEKHTVAKLIGSPAGYVGYEEGGLLTEEIRKNPSSVLLLDEIEKAHADIYNILLQVMDYATLTDNQGRKADFRNVIVIMTSNAGANRIGKKSIGFQSETYDSSVVMDAVKQTFQPEFRNRLNRIVVFNGMDDHMAERVVEKKLSELKGLLVKQNISMTVDDSAFKLVKNKGISEEFGAREVDRVIRNEIKPLLVDDILFGKLKDGGELTITADNNGFQVVID
ncbi:MAG: AAA family ATPase [Lachnospiraceae bacterium]|nr:AAA family ATPase [Lachnospiraceae bacterium]